MSAIQAVGFSEKSDWEVLIVNKCCLLTLWENVLQVHSHVGQLQIEPGAWVWTSKLTWKHGHFFNLIWRHGPVSIRQEPEEGL